MSAFFPGCVQQREKPRESYTLSLDAAVEMADAIIADLEHWWQQQGEQESLVSLHQEFYDGDGHIGFILAEIVEGRLQRRVVLQAARVLNECMYVKELAENDSSTEGGSVTPDYLQVVLTGTAFLAGVFREMTGTPTRRFAVEMAKVRHKDNHADRDFIREWYRENRATYEKELGGKGGKDAAATDAKEQRLVNQGWRTIRGYLNNV